ncbi:MAG: response regulator transcription factor [Phycisphaerales bacterium]|nr:MAG: response regulator transcription factor [Phycisphaerales bacterium]
MARDKSRCVILADRHQNLLEGLRSLLETMFETVVMVADKRSLLDAADRIQPDLAVVDLSLAASGGVSIAREISDSYPELKLIILSVHDEPTVIDEAIAAGAAGFVLKRSVATDLFKAVESVQQGETFVSASARR